MGGDLMKEQEEDSLYEVLNPRGTQLPINLTPLTPRLPNLKSKKVYFVDFGKPESDTAYDALKKYLNEFVPDRKFINYTNVNCFSGQKLMKPNYRRLYALIIMPWEKK